MKQYKIGLIGNCQLKALTHYMHKLPGEHTVNYLPISFKTSRGNWDAPWFYSQSFESLPTPVLVVANTSERNGKTINYISDSDLIICQPITPTTNPIFNIDKLLDYTGPNTKILTIPSFHFCETDPVFLQKTRINETNKNIMIRTSAIVDKFPGKVECKRTESGWNHPNSFYFLELTRMICEYVGLDFYDSETYYHYLNLGYPFYLDSK